MMSRVQKGLAAGFAATVAVSALEAINMLAGRWFEPFPLFVAGLIGMPGNLAVGWIAHVFSGTVLLGGLFGVLCPRLPTDTPETKGILFAVAAWALLMVGVLLFASRNALGGGFPMIGWMLVTHVVFGIVLGNVYARLVAREKRAHAGLDGVAPAH